MQTRHALLGALGLVPHAGIGSDRSAVNAEVGHLADEGIGGRLPDVRGQRTCIGARQFLLAVLALHDLCRTLCRRGHQIHDAVQEWGNAHLVSTRGHEDRRERSRVDNVLETANQLLVREGTVLEIFFEQGVFALGCGFHEREVGFVRLGFHIRRNIGDRLAVGHVGFHGDEIDHAFEFVLLTDGQLHLDHTPTRGLHELFDGLVGAGETGILAIHAVDDEEARQAKIHGGAPGQFGADFDPTHRIHEDDRAVRHAESRDHLADKIGVTRCVEHIDLVVTIFNGKNAGVERKFTADFLFIVIRSGCPILDLAETGGGPRKMQKRLGQHGFACRAMRDEGDVPNELGGILFHYVSLSTEMV